MLWITHHCRPHNHTRGKTKVIGEKEKETNTSPPLKQKEKDFHCLYLQLLVAFVLHLPCNTGQVLLEGGTEYVHTHTLWAVLSDFIQCNNTTNTWRWVNCAIKIIIKIIDGVSLEVKLISVHYSYLILQMHFVWNSLMTHSLNSLLILLFWLPLSAHLKHCHFTF